jgi:hypothetical protein
MLRWFLSCGVIWCSLVKATDAEVAVLANRTPQQLTVELRFAGRPSRTLVIPAGDCRPAFFSDRLSVRFGPLLAPQMFPLAGGAAYYFAQDATSGELIFERIGLGPSDEKPSQQPLQDTKPEDTGFPVVIPVKIAVDDNEPTYQSVWEPRLRTRVSSASQFLELHCGVKLEVVAAGTWKSDDSITNFSQSLREFENAVKPDGGQLVIGFSSQYEIVTGPIHMGGSRGPLHPYLLIKERAPNIHEPERLELLIHELGHFLGAAHSPEPDSAMRSLLRAGQSRAAGASIHCDPVNTLLMSLVAEELRSGKVRNLADVSYPTKQRMTEIYTVLQQALPRDPAAAQLRWLVGNVQSSHSVQDVRGVLLQLKQFAKFEQARAAQHSRTTPDSSPAATTGDDLTGRYVREAADIVAETDSPEARKTLLIALGIFLDDSDTLRVFPTTRTLVVQAESDAERQERLAVLGEPTMRGRRDLAKHFFVSAHLAAVMGDTAARSLGLIKELRDAQGGSGFSFVDLAANRAGLIFAEKLLARAFTPEQLARGFVVDKFLPEIDDLDEGMQSEDFEKRFGDSDPAAFQATLEEIDRRILELPVYGGDR